MKICKTQPDEVYVTDNIHKIENTIRKLRRKIELQDESMNNLDKSEKIELKKHLSIQKELQDEVNKLIIQKSQLTIEVKDLVNKTSKKCGQLKIKNYKNDLQGEFFCFSNKNKVFSMWKKENNQN